MLSHFISYVCALVKRLCGSWLPTIHINYLKSFKSNDTIILFTAS